MRIELAGWSSEGLRCPDVKIDLRNAAGSAVPIALIQTPNGTGKTTMLKMLKACLNGEASGWSADYIREFKRHDDERSFGTFTADLIIDERILTIEVTLDFDEGRAAYRTSSPQFGGVVAAYDPPADARRFLDKAFLNLFIFDGEYASRLLDPAKAEAEYAIDALCQLYLLKNMSAVANSAWERAARNVQVTTEVGLNREFELKRALEERLKFLKANRGQLSDKLKTLQAKIDEYQAKVDQRLSTEDKTREQHAEAREAKALAKADVEMHSLRLSQQMRLPHALHPMIGATLNQLKENLDRLRLPENTSSQFFDEIVDEEFCICGRVMDEAAIVHIKSSSKQYLGEKEIAVINEIKSDIEKYITNESDLFLRSELESSRNALKESQEKLRLSEQKLNYLTEKLIRDGDGDLEELSEALRVSRIEFEKCDALLKQMSDDSQATEIRRVADVPRFFSIPLLERKLKELDGRISDVTKTVDMRKKTEALVKILESARDRAREKIKDELLLECNSRLKDVLVNDLLQIASIDRSLKLANQAGASVGQTLSVGYVFLMSILNRGSHDFPLVVDSPAGALDTDVKSEIGALIPALCSQFVAFTIDSEREGFVTALEKSGKPIKFMTLLRKTPGTERFMHNLPREGVVETDASVLVTDRKYFFSLKKMDSEALHG